MALYSGSMVSYCNFLQQNSRCPHIKTSTDQADNFADIIIYLGVNDFGNGVLLKGKPLADKFWEQSIKTKVGVL